MMKQLKDTFGPIERMYWDNEELSVEIMCSDGVMVEEAPCFLDGNKVIAFCNSRQDFFPMYEGANLTDAARFAEAYAIVWAVQNYGEEI